MAFPLKPLNLEGFYTDAEVLSDIRCTGFVRSAESRPGIPASQLISKHLRRTWRSIAEKRTTE
ncbi:unnamed protein product [Notodromas monacha]|uniref:Uncharacterized protein n=1 Tax=Notodromas monacha TaxID=399045 RepID=A0A7R9BVZ7_9CRUS|nr:unnamed protein product [Notodromas monacha]CAG0922753.1 unnamed protein product [Notodromas monacha]